MYTFVWRKFVRSCSKQHQRKRELGLFVERPLRCYCYVGLHRILARSLECSSIILPRTSVFVLINFLVCVCIFCSVRCLDMLSGSLVAEVVAHQAPFSGIVLVTFVLPIWYLSDHPRILAFAHHDCCHPQARPRPGGALGCKSG